MAFKLPPWAAAPSRDSSLVDDATGNVIPTAAKPAYVFGTDPSDCDVPVMNHGEARGGHVGALVHHSDGRTFLIALQPSSSSAAAASVAVNVDGNRLPLHKPTALRNGSKVSFEAPEGASSSSFTFECDEEARATTTTKTTTTTASASPSSVRASHLLVKHSGSRRPSSWKEPVVTRSIEEARAMVSAFRERILQQGGGASAEALAAAFASLAAVESHCSSARNGGDLGPFSRGQMQRVFEDAAFGLGVGEMSGLVESDSGVHIILRTE